MLIIYHVVFLHTDQLNTGEGFTIFATCSNEWCLQKGLQKPQHKNSSSNSEKLCEKYGGVYVSHITVGTRTNYAVCGCKYYDDPRNWHWCDLKDGYWNNHSLDYYKTSNNFITSITCINRPLKPSKAVEESNSIVDEPHNIMEEPNNVVQKPHNVVVEPDNLVEEPNTVAEKSGIFTNCHNEWCLQKGLQKPQYTKCESVTNNGKTCNNPEIKYIYSYTVTVGFPWEFSSNNYEKWCEQLGGVYVGHTFGTRRGHPVIGCTLDAQGRMTDPRNWHWCEYWYDYHATSNKFITSITCMN